MARVIVCGGRVYGNRRRLHAVLDAAVQRLGLDHVIAGGAMGADSLAAEWARLRDIPIDVFKAHWGREGKAAGHIRNARMIEQGKPDLVIAFPGGRGTANMVGQALAAGIPVHKIDWPAEAENAFPEEPDPTGQMALRL
ncbi:DUF2493 domain-containing protein [Devosia ginsengisoli]|uniref:DUF2493 domain-containing protein n=1 Tax=Devosia ginsengisoli TaxID=400770 RepID=UPI0026E9C6EB|nr:DUF2493 domain-containing protein [Devosia ginsengisoli]MCR6673261.1 DUF2493 domain-containing protein [Devosia ginsengisoli]